MTIKTLSYGGLFSIPPSRQPHLNPFVHQVDQQWIVARHVELAGVAVVSVDQHHARVQRGGGVFHSGSGNDGKH